MINNKQVNIWRGDREPPTIYHVWITDEWILKLYNGTEWIPFVDNMEVVIQIDALLNRLDLLESLVNSEVTNIKGRLSPLEEFWNNNTINNKKIKNNPILNAEDLLTAKSGLYVKENDNVADALMKLDKLFDIQIIE